MKRKVQTFGINKDYLIKLHKNVIQDIMRQGYIIPEEKLKEFIRLSIVQSKVILFGLSELNNTENDFNKSILRRFPAGFSGINRMIEENALQSRHIKYSEWIVNILRQTRNYMVRSLSDIPTSKEEQSYLDNIEEFESFLENYYEEKALALIVELENKLKKSLTEIYNDDSLSSTQAIEKAHSIIDDYKKEIQNEFETQIQDDLYKESILLGIAGLASLGLDKVSEEDINEEKKIVRYGFASNIAAYFFNELRRVKENVVDTVSTKDSRRSLATEQLQTLSLNKNTFKLSLLTHPRALFRAIIRKASQNYSHYKAVVSPLYYDRVNPSGMTADVAYTIRTPDEWAAYTGYKNVNVVGGLSLHHNDTLYYVPVHNTEEDKALAKEQRKLFLQDL